MVLGDGMDLAAARSLSSWVAPHGHAPRLGGRLDSTTTRIFPNDNPAKANSWQIIVYTDMDSWCGYSEILLNYLEHKQLDYLQVCGLSLQGRHGVSEALRSKGLFSTPQLKRARHVLALLSDLLVELLQRGVGRQRHMESIGRRRE